MKKLTKRQQEVLNLLRADPGRRLTPGKGGYYNLEGPDGRPIPNTRGIAPIVINALANAGLISWPSDARGFLAVTPEASS